MRIKFIVGSTAASSAITLSDIPLAREMVDVAAQELPVVYRDGALILGPTATALNGPLLSVSSLANGTLVLHLTRSVGQRVELQASSDLVSWKGLTELILINGNADFVEMLDVDR